METESFKKMLRHPLDICFLIILIVILIFIFRITKQFSLFNATNQLYLKKWNDYAYQSKRIGKKV